MKIQPIWLKYAILYFAISMLLAFISMYVGTLPGIINFVAFIAIIWITTKMMMDEIKESNQSPYPTYGEAFRPIFLMIMVGSIVYSIVNSVWINYIDKSRMDVIVENALESSKWWLELFNVPEEQMAEVMDKAESDTLDRLQFGAQLKWIWLGPIFSAILAAIVALFYKKEEKIG